MLSRNKHAAKHRNAVRSPATRNLRRVGLASAVAILAAGVAVGSGSVSSDETPADATTGTVTLVHVEPASSRVTATRPVVDRPSRSDRRAAPDSEKEQDRDRSSRREKSRAVDPNAADPRAVARRMLPEFGFSSSEFGCLDALYVSESDWDMYADNPTSTAYGIPQALMSAHELPADYTTNQVTQIRWGLGYIRDSYGTPCAAWEFKQANNYY